MRTAATLHAKSFTREGLTKEDWKKAGLDEPEDPEVADKKKEPAEPSSVEELGKLMSVLENANMHNLLFSFLNSLGHLM